MPIVDARGFNLMPDAGAQLGRGLSLLGQSQQLQAQGQQLQAGQQQQATQQQIQQLTGRAVQGDQDALRQLAGISTEAASGVQKFLRDDFDAQDEIDKLQDVETAQLAVRLKNTTSRDEQLRLINNEVERNAKAGRDFTNPPFLKNLLEAGQEGEFDTKIEQIITSSQQLGILDPKAFAATGVDATTSEVQSAKILPGGVVQIVRKDGTVEVKQPEEVSTDIVKRAEERGVNLQQRRAQGRTLGKDAAKVSTETVKKVGLLRQNNEGLRKVISEVKAGAETGPLAAKLPSFRAASVRLEQLRNEQGLDVIGSVTFGALSEGELNLALDTALPTRLEGPELVKWAEEKIAAQEKLANYLEDQAIFLGRGGNTPAGWLELQKSKAEKAAQPEPQPAQPQAGQTQTIGRFQVRVK